MVGSTASFLADKFDSLPSVLRLGRLEWNSVRASRLRKGGRGVGTGLETATGVAAGVGSAAAVRRVLDFATLDVFFCAGAGFWYCPSLFATVTAIGEEKGDSNASWADATRRGAGTTILPFSATVSGNRDVDGLVRTKLDC